MPSPASGLRGAGFALLAFGIFAAHDVLVKLLGGVYAPFQIVFFSVLLGFPWLTVMLIRDARPGNLRPRYPGWSAARTACVVTTGVCAFYAFSVLPLAQTYAILFATPLLITLLAIPVLGEKVGIRRGLAVLIGLLGVIVVLRPGSTELGLGHAAAMLAAISSATASVIVRRIGRHERSAVLLLYPMLANFLIMGSILPFVYKPMPLLHLAAMAMVAALAFIATSMMILAYRKSEAAVVAPMQYSQILWAALYGALIFGERPDRMTAIGAGIIIASGLYILLREGRSTASANQPVLRTRSRPETGTHPRVGQMLTDEEKGPPARPPEP